MEAFGEQRLFDHLAPDVADQDVELLNAGGDGTGDDAAYGRYLFEQDRQPRARQGHATSRSIGTT